MTPQFLCAVAAIEDGGAVVATADMDGDAVEILIVRRGGEIWAYRNRCPHFSVGLDAQPGVVHTYRGQWLMCAHHSALFRFEDGHCVDGPCEGHRLEPVAVCVENGRVLLPPGAHSASCQAIERRKCRAHASYVLGACFST